MKLISTEGRISPGIPSPTHPSIPTLKAYGWMRRSGEATSLPSTEFTWSCLLKGELCGVGKEEVDGRLRGLVFGFARQLPKT